MARATLLAAAAVLALSSASFAQSEGSAGSQGTTAAPAAPAKPSSFEAMPAGDRKIGRALFLAQRPTASGPAPMSLNQIADLKAHSTWAKVFTQMQSRGLLQAKNLGQIVSGYEHQRSDARPEPRSRASHDSTTLVTGGSGSVVASSQRGGGISHGGDVVGETSTSADIAAVDKRAAPAERRGR